MKVFVITGQTATGKTKFALELAKKYNGELINADSRQIYKRLDIITGKDINQISNNKYQISKKISNFDVGYYDLNILATNHQPLTTKLWLYDIIDPKIYFSSFDFVQCALTVIKDIIRRGKTPIIVGGTYFYLYHLLYDVPTQSIPADWTLRNDLNKKTVSELQLILKKIAPQFINGLSQSELHNPQRLIRKIEILTYQKKNHLPQTVFDALKIALPITLDKKLGIKISIDFDGFRYKNTENLRSVIRKRVEERLKNGAIREVQMLLKNKYTISDPGLKTIGYKQVLSYLHKKISEKQAVEEWMTREAQYAKRQYTFMKRDKYIKWCTVD